MMTKHAHDTMNATRLLSDGVRSCPARSRVRRSRYVPAIDSLECRALLSTTAGLTASTAAEVSAECHSTRSQGGTWTVMVYITGDNLNANLARNILQMEDLAASLPSSVKIVVYWSQPTLQYKGDPVFETGNNTQVWSNGVTSGMGVIQGASHDPASLSNLQDLPPIATTFQLGRSNSADPSTLESFMEYAKKVAPAEHYALIFSDHGGGVDGFNYDSNFESSKGSNTELTVPGVAPVLATLAAQGMKLSDIAFDECYMASIEVEYGLRAYAPYIIASEEIVSGAGFDYTDALSELATNPAKVSSLQFANKLVTSFGVQYGSPSEPNNTDTLSNVSTSKLNAVIHDLKRFVADASNLDAQEWAGILEARSATTHYGSYPDRSVRDLGQFLEALSTDESSSRLRADAQTTLNALRQAVVTKTNDIRYSTGVSVVLPQPPEKIPPRYATKAASFLTVTGWSGFLNDLEAHSPSLTSVELPDWAEPNNSASRATSLGQIQPNRPLTIPDLTLPTGDIDWFGFSTVPNVTPKGSLTFEETGGASSDVELQIYANQGKSLELEFTVVGSSFDLSNLAPGGDYLLKVSHAQNGAAFGYSLDFDPTADGSATPASVPSTNLTEATADDLGTVTGSGLASITEGTSFTDVLSEASATQPQWYQFETASSTTPIQGSFTVISSSHLQINLYDQNGGVIGSYKSGDTIPYSADGGAEPFSFSVGGAMGTYEIFFNPVNSESTV